MADVHLILHMPKTGGRNLADLLSRCPSICFCHDTNRRCRDRLLRFYRKKKNDGRPVVLMAHWLMGLHHSIGCAPRYHTIFRDPVERDVSEYHFLRQRPDGHKNGQLAASAGLCEFIAQMSPNIQAQHLLTGPYSPPFEVKDEHYDLAQLTLTNLFESVGSHDRYAESVCRIGRCIGVDLSGVEETETLGSAKKRDLNEQELLALRERNRVDTRLYDWVRSCPCS